MLLLVGGRLRVSGQLRHHTRVVPIHIICLSSVRALHMIETRRVTLHTLAFIRDPYRPAGAISSSVTRIPHSSVRWISHRDLGVIFTNLRSAHVPVYNLNLVTVATYWILALVARPGDQSL
jgi:hypothetical protein